MLDGHRVESFQTHQLLAAQVNATCGKEIVKLTQPESELFGDKRSDDPASIAAERETFRQMFAAKFGVTGPGVQQGEQP